jgi:hypothetical protein
LTQRERLLQVLVTNITTGGVYGTRGHRHDNPLSFATWLKAYQARTRFSGTQLAFFANTSEKTIYMWLAGSGPDLYRAKCVRDLFEAHEPEFASIRGAIDAAHRTGTFDRLRRHP